MAVAIILVAAVEKQPWFPCCVGKAGEHASGHRGALREGILVLGGAVLIHVVPYGLCERPCSPVYAPIAVVLCFLQVRTSARGKSPGSYAGDATTDEDDTPIAIATSIVSESCCFVEDDSAIDSPSGGRTPLTTALGILVASLR